MEGTEMSKKLVDRLSTLDNVSVLDISGYAAAFQSNANDTIYFVFAGSEGYNVSIKKRGLGFVSVPIAFGKTFKEVVDFAKTV